MKALILGAAGQVGRALAAAAPDGVETIAVTRTQCDLADAGQIESCISRIRPDILINAAAYTAVDKAEADVEAARLVNGVAPGLIAAAARAGGARTIHVSTDFVFDGNVARPRAPGDATSPVSVYGQTKLEGERAVTEADPNGLIVRTAWVYSAGAGNFLSTMLRLMRERESVSVVADQFGTPTHAGSLAKALWAFAAADASGIYHYTDAGTATWYDFAVAIEEEASAIGLLTRPVRIVPIATNDYPTPARRPAFSVLDNSATWERLGGAAPHWRTNLRLCLQELLTNG